MNEVCGDRHQRVHATILMILHLHLKAVGGAIAAYHGLCERHYLSLTDVSHTTVDFCHHALEVVAFATTLVPVLQSEQEHTIVGTLSCHSTYTNALGIRLYLRQVGDKFFHTVHHLMRSLLCATRLRLHGDVNHAHIFVGHKSRLGGRQ